MMNKKLTDLTGWESIRWLFVLVAVIYVPIYAVYWIWLKWDAIKSRLSIRKKKDEPNPSKIEEDAYDDEVIMKW